MQELAKQSARARALIHAPNLTLAEREARAYALGHPEQASLALALDAEDSQQAKVEQLEGTIREQDDELSELRWNSPEKLKARFVELVGEVDEALRGGKDDTIEKLIPRVEAVLHRLGTLP
jgi:hypothetical protein